MVGPKGRGKTTHLRALHSYLNIGEYISLNHQNKLIDCKEKGIYFIDSIHHLPFSERLRLWRSNSSFVITTHITKSPEFLIGRRKYESIQIGQKSFENLKRIVSKRIAMAAKINPKDVLLNERHLKELLKKHKTNTRGIINQLYSEFESYE